MLKDINDISSMSNKRWVDRLMKKDFQWRNFSNDITNFENLKYLFINNNYQEQKLWQEQVEYLFGWWQQ